MLLSTLLALSLSAHAQAAPEADPAKSQIVNGQEVKGKAWPAAVALGISFGRQTQQMCSASLITPRIVLTAGHCTKELVPEQYEDLITQYMKVYFGDNVNGSDVQAVGLESVHPHPKYASNESTGAVSNDINLLVLDTDVDWVEPVWFRETPVTEKHGVGDTVTSVGFGITSSAAQSSNGIKREADLVINRADTQFIYTDYSTNPGNTNICSGDSGGPQYGMINGHLEQWGVHSFGFGNNPSVDLCFQQSGSTNVGSYEGFIWKLIHEVHGDDYLPTFAAWDYCADRGLYADRHCDPNCASQDEDCVLDTNEDGEVDDAEFAAFDRDDDGTVSPAELIKGPRGCDQTGGMPGSLALLAGAAIALRRRARR